MYIVSGPLITAKQGFLCGSAIKLTRRVIDRLNANVDAKQRLPDGLGTTTTRTAMNLGEPAQHPFGNVLICSPLSKIPVTTAKHRSTIHRHSRQKRRTYLEQRPMTPLEHVSPWSKSFADSERRSDWGISAKKHKSRPQNTGTLGTAHRPRRRKRRERTQRVCHTPYVQPFSQLPSLPTPTQPNTTLPTVVHVETPLSPSRQRPATQNSSETLNEPPHPTAFPDQLRNSSRPSSSASSGIRPLKG